jgi:hypothetical protein
VKYRTHLPSAGEILNYLKIRCCQPEKHFAAFSIVVMDTMLYLFASIDYLMTPETPTDRLISE